MDGNVIWEWNISDHLVQNYSSEHPNYGVVSEYPGKMDPNFGGGVGGDWIHINGFDYNEVLDQVVINNSIFSEFYVVDHGATFIPGDPEGSAELAAGDEGDFIFRWGNPCVYDSGECPRSINEGQSSVMAIRWLVPAPTGIFSKSHQGAKWSGSTSTRWATGRAISSGSTRS